MSARFLWRGVSGEVRLWEQRHVSRRNRHVYLWPGLARKKVSERWVNSVKRFQTHTTECYVIKWQHVHTFGRTCPCPTASQQYYTIACYMYYNIFLDIFRLKIKPVCHCVHIVIRGSQSSPSYIIQMITVSKYYTDKYWTVAQLSNLIIYNSTWLILFLYIWVILSGDNLI